MRYGARSIGVIQNVTGSLMHYLLAQELTECGDNIPRKPALEEAEKSLMAFSWTDRERRYFV